MQNYNLDIKRTFLSFAQALFEQHAKYTWNVDPVKTKVLIVDKNVINLNVVEKKRSIILSRGAYGWKYSTLGQRGQLSTSHTIGDEMIKGRKSYSDLIRGSITFNCIAQNGLIAEDMAHILFINMVGHRDQFKKNGIHQIVNMNIGEETLLKTDSSIEVVAIPLYIQFETQKNLLVGDSFYTFVLVDQDNTNYHESTDYYIENNKVSFYEAPKEGYSFTATYIHAITLQEHTEPLIGIVDGTNKDFTVTYPIYTGSPLVENILFSISD